MVFARLRYLIEKNAEIQVLEIEILEVIDLFLKPLNQLHPGIILSVHRRDIGHKRAIIMLIFVKLVLNSQFST